MMVSCDVFVSVNRQLAFANAASDSDDDHDPGPAYWLQLEEPQVLFHAIMPPSVLVWVGVDSSDEGEAAFLFISGEVL